MIQELMLRQLQFAAGGSAGGVFLGDPEGENDVNGNTGDDPNDGGQEAILNGMIYVGALLLGICFIALFTWIFSRVIDRFCCCLPGWRPVSFTAQWDHSPLARKARLCKFSTSTACNWC
jgi:hypothetical protein